MTMHRTIHLLTCALACAAAAAPLAGCRGDRSPKRPRQILPDMDDQYRVRAQSRTTFYDEFIDEESGNHYGRSQREPVAGTIPFGRELHGNEVYTDDHMVDGQVMFAGINADERSRFLAEDDALFLGVEMNADGTPRTNPQTGEPIYLARMPIPVTMELIHLGQQKYTINCLPCHGGSGMGDGMVGLRWNAPLPKYTDEPYMPGGLKSADGYIFHTIRHGVANPGKPYLKMPSYARKLTVQETWAIVAYVRTLQAAMAGSEAARGGAAAGAPTTTPNQEAAQ